MAALPETQFVFANIPANNARWQGEHTHHRVKAISQGMYLGSVPFDPALHEPQDIDHLSPLGLALDEDYAYQVLPGSGLIANLVVDSTSRSELPQITSVKSSLVTELSDSLHSVKSTTDRILTYNLIDQGAQSSDWDSDPIEVDGPAALTQTIAGLALGSLTFVISDFKRVRFDEPGLDLENVVAIKVNHILERRLPAGRGFISMGGLVDVNTTNPRQLKQANAQRAAEHAQLVQQLEQAGAAVASVVVEPRLADGFNIAAADRAIAQAIQQKL
jgi:hypothetical protein